MYLLELKSAVAALLIFLGSWRSWVYFKALVMSDGARRLLRDAWDGKRGGGGEEGGEKLFHVPSFPRLHRAFSRLCRSKYPQCCQWQRLLMAIPTHREKKVPRRSLKTQRNNICKTLAMNYTPSTIPCETSTYPDCVRNVNTSESFCRWLYRWNDERIKLDIGLISRC